MRPALVALVGVLAVGPALTGIGPGPAAGLGAGIARAEPGPQPRDDGGDSGNGGGGGGDQNDDLGAVAEQIAATRERIDELGHQMSVAAEHYNAERIRLAEADRAAAAARERLEAADTAVRTAAARHRGLATSAYRSRGLDQLSILLTGDPRTALDRAGAVDALSRRQRAAQADLRLARHDQTEAKDTADETRASRQRLVDSLAGQRRALEASAAEQHGLLDTLIDRQAELEREAREREAAALRARQAAEAAAAAQAAREAAAERERLTREAGLVATAGSTFAAAPVLPAPPPPTGGSGGAARAVQEAHAQLGKPYVWGGEGPNSFDCSGLTQWVWGKAGVGIPHYTGDQWTAGRHVSRAELIPGDLVFFGADLYHVGLYIGGDQMIHAPRTGEVIRIEDVWWSSFQGGVRPGA
ncbi:glycoside hydrolase [Parafrankia colletiae]|uniref:Glycoside hydrolase n=1 Tax=Parafrankia colletiae TaxID=573497 RepID=A0A1S1QYV5_9ACTN|nr:C40 family peptidase [Parafrankia colletiae]MCK9899159.1 C40 family peptidase [Frankia sp. Cpl3]OHV38709.1 glycoside hydrolase [Parafrankia colletiae]